MDFNKGLTTSITDNNLGHDYGELIPSDLSYTVIEDGEIELGIL